MRCRWVVILFCSAACIGAEPPPATPPSATSPEAPRITPSGFRLYDNDRIPDDIEVIKDVIYGQGGALPLRLNIVREKNQAGPPKPVIIYLPGGAFLTSDRNVATGRLAALAQRGFIGVAVQYRTSSEGKFPAQIEDCKCAVRFLRAKAADYHLDPDRIGVWGASAGATLAALLGTTDGRAELEGSGGWSGFSSRVQAVSAWYGSFDLRGADIADPENPVFRWFGVNPHAVPERAKLASPLAQISPTSAPFFAVVGDRDHPSVLKQSELMVAALKEAGAEATLLVVPGYGHGFITATEAEQMLAFFTRHLKSARSASQVGK
jgi:acetyl esterase/lipase